MNHKAVAYQAIIFSCQWVLMVAGFGILSQFLAPTRILPLDMPYGGYLDAGVKALVALCLSAIWLFLWDWQVRFLFYRRGREMTT